MKGWQIKRGRGGEREERKGGGGRQKEEEEEEGRGQGENLLLRLSFIENLLDPSLFISMIYLI